MEDGASIRRGEAGSLEIKNPRSDHHLTDSVSTVWTDEKHITFLNSMEASFVDELYTKQYLSKDLPGWFSRWRKRVQSTDCYKNVKSDQCKILHRGYWNNLNLVNETAESHIDMKTDSIPLGSNPWIRRLRSINTGKETHSKPSDMINEKLHNPISTKKSQRYSEATDLEKLQTVCHFCPQCSADGIGEEASDQNFIGDELDTGESRTCKKLRLKTRSPDAVPNSDQVVSSKNPILVPNSSENHAYLVEEKAENSYRTSEQTVSLLVGEGV